MKLEDKACLDMSSKPDEEERTIIVQTPDSTIILLGTNTRKSQAEIILQKGSVYGESDENDSPVSVSHATISGDFTRFSSVYGVNMVFADNQYREYHFSGSDLNKNLSVIIRGIRTSFS